MGDLGETFDKRTGAVRKNCRTLTADEIARYVTGVKTLKKSGAYDQLVQLHVDAMKTPAKSRTSAAHGGPVFLPWHRRFVLEFELAMGKVLGDPNYGVPYWDWSQDSGREMASVVWGETFLGGGGWPVSSGPFALRANWEAWAAPAAKPAMTQDLSRTCGGAFPPPSPTTTTAPPTTGPPTTNPPTTNRLPPPSSRSSTPQAPPVLTLPSAAEVDEVVSVDVDAYDAAPWDMHATTGFRNLLEGFARSPHFVDPAHEPQRQFFLHTWVHMWVGGHMGFGFSPTDPIFFLHHSFVDRLWAKWQFLTLGQHGYGEIPSDTSVPVGHRPGQPMLRGFDGKGGAIPWTSDLSEGHPNPEDWDVHENFRYRYDDESTWHRTVRLRPVSQPQNWVSATYHTDVKVLSGPVGIDPEGTPPTIGHSGWQTVVLRPGFVSSSTSARSVSIQAASNGGNDAPYYPALDPAQDPNLGMFLHVGAEQLGYISPGSGNFSKDPVAAKRALTWQLTVTSAPNGQASQLRAAFMDGNGDHLLAGDAQVTTGSDISTGRQWFVLDSRSDGGERVVCWHTGFRAPCDQSTPCDIDGAHCIILESGQRVGCWHNAFLRVGGTGSLKGIAIRCDCTHVDGTTCLVLQENQRVVCWHDGFESVGGSSCNCTHVDLAYCIVLQDRQRVVCHHYGFQAFGGPACGCTHVDWVNVKIIS